MARHGFHPTAMSTRADSPALRGRLNAGTVLGRQWARSARGRSEARTISHEAVLSLRFARRGGPLLALAGVCGGAGTTTLAYLIAAAAARISPEHVLLADLGGPAAAVSTFAGAESAHPFPVLADHLARGRRPPRQSFATAEEGLRVLASRPEIDEPVPEDAARQVLVQARAAHALTVVDAGALVRPVERLAVSLATHVAWVLPATPLGVRRAAVLLGRIRCARTARPLVVARSTGEPSRAVIADLADLADLLAAPLVLIPQLADVLEADTADVIDQAATSLQAIGVVLGR
jgi:Flp pilus assembly CpaE family ATPase